MRTALNTAKASLVKDHEEQLGGIRRAMDGWQGTRGGGFAVYVDPPDTATCVVCGDQAVLFVAVDDPTRTSGDSGRCACSMPAA